MKFWINRNGRRRPKTWEQATAESRSLTWIELTEAEAQALEAEGPIFSFIKDGVPTLSVDLSSVDSSQDPQPSTDSSSEAADSAPDSPTNPTP